MWHKECRLVLPGEPQVGEEPVVVGNGARHPHHTLRGWPDAHCGHDKGILLFSSLSACIRAILCCSPFKVKMLSSSS